MTTYKCSQTKCYQINFLDDCQILTFFLMNETLQKLIDGHINILYPIMQITYLY